MDIGPDKHVLWKTDLTPGHSSPAIVGDKIFLTAVREKEHLETICLDRATGIVLGRVEAPHKTLEKIHGIGCYAQQSPAADADRVVVLFGSSGLYCYDHGGKELWHVPMGPFNDEFGAMGGSTCGRAGTCTVLAKRVNDWYNRARKIAIYSPAEQPHGDGRNGARDDGGDGGKHR
jgi:hypothetical protein